MKANEFVKKFGWDEIYNFIKNPLKLDSETEFLLNYSDKYLNPIQLKQDEFEQNELAGFCEKEWYWVSRWFDKNDDEILENNFVSIADLKRIIESHELVDVFGGINGARKELANLCDNLVDCAYLCQAIADVESCQ